MRIERLSLKGLLGFSDTVSLDLRDVGPGLIAITGPNGAGKTTILEAALATLQRKFITREGPLHEYAGHRRDSYLDVDVALDGVGMYRARVNIDGLKSTSDAVLELVQANGTRTVLNDGKASTFDVAVAAHFPSRAVLLASNFAAQNKKGSFTASDKRARKDLFGAILGLEQYQTLSDTAKQAAAFVDQAIGRLRATRDTLARDTADGVVAALDSLARMLQVDGGTAEVRQRELATAIERADERLAALADEVAAHAALTLRVRDLETQLATRRAEQVQLDVDRGRATRQADEDLAQLTRASDAQLTEIDELLTNNRRLLANAEPVKDAKVALGLAASGLEDARSLEGELRQALDVEAQRLGDLRSRQSVLTAARKDLTRAEMDARTLTVVPCHGEGAYAACQFLHNAREAAGYVPVLQAQVADEDDVQAASSCARCGPNGTA
jgi:exonuclease SbcC